MKPNRSAAAGQQSVECSTLEVRFLFSPLLACARRQSCVKVICRAVTLHNHLRTARGARRAIHYAIDETRSKTRDSEFESEAKRWQDPRQEMHEARETFREGRTPSTCGKGMLECSFAFLPLLKLQAPYLCQRGAVAAARWQLYPLGCGSLRFRL